VAGGRLGGRADLRRRVARRLPCRSRARSRRPARRRARRPAADQPGRVHARLLRAAGTRRSDRPVQRRTARRAAAQPAGAQRGTAADRAREPARTARGARHAARRRAHRHGRRGRVPGARTRRRDGPVGGLAGRRRRDARVAVPGPLGAVPAPVHVRHDALAEGRAVLAPLPLHRVVGLHGQPEPHDRERPHHADADVSRRRAAHRRQLGAARRLRRACEVEVLGVALLAAGRGRRGDVGDRARSDDGDDRQAHAGPAARTRDAADLLPAAARQPGAAGGALRHRTADPGLRDDRDLPDADDARRPGRGPTSASSTSTTSSSPPGSSARSSSARTSPTR
jgi:hypothetical protein